MRRKNTLEAPQLTDVARLFTIALYSIYKQWGVTFCLRFLQLSHATATLFRFAGSTRLLNRRCAAFSTAETADRFVFFEEGDANNTSGSGSSDGAVVMFAFSWSVFGSMFAG
jgi:hypothetical protein